MEALYLSVTFHWEKQDVSSGEKLTTTLFPLHMESEILQILDVYSFTS